MKKRLIFALFVFSVLSLSACCAQPAPEDKPLVRVVTRISISADGVTRSYSSTESLEAILAYLRQLSPMTNADQSPSQGSMYRISLVYSDGSRQDFRQRDRYFLDTDGKWKNITEGDILKLCKLFNLLEPENLPSAI